MVMEVLYFGSQISVESNKYFVWCTSHFLKLPSWWDRLLIKLCSYRELFEILRGEVVYLKFWETKCCIWNFEIWSDVFEILRDEVLYLKCWDMKWCIWNFERWSVVFEILRDEVMYLKFWEMKCCRIGHNFTKSSFVICILHLIL